MEKVIYVLAAPTDTDRQSWGERLVDSVAAALAAAGAKQVSVNVADAAVAPAAPLKIVTSDQPADATVSLWLDSAVGSFRSDIDAVLAAESSHLAAYVVTESVPLDTATAPVAGERSEGFSQMAFIRRPAGMDLAEFHEIWLNSHTTVAVDLQDTSLYIQNAVARRLTEGAPEWDAIVEEGFPAAAMTDPHAFFDSSGDDALLATRQQAMFESVQRFIDLGAIEVIPTSRYPNLA